MDTLARTAAAYPLLRHAHIAPSGIKKDPSMFFRNSYFASLSSAIPFPSLTLRKSVIVGAKKDGDNNQDKKRKEDTHSFVAREDESIGGLFPEALLLREKKLQEDGRFLPDFADAQEEKLYEFLNLELQSQVKVDRMRHYEVVYLIHEKHADELRYVNDKVRDFVREKKGKIWRFNDWGMRWLAYPIQKADYAHYILMNFEMEAKWLNDFKSLLDKDERVIRHLVMKRDEAITEDYPPPPEFLTLSAESGGNDFDFDFDDDEEDDSEYDNVEEGDSEYDNDEEDDSEYVNDEEEDSEYVNDEEEDYENDGDEEDDEDLDGEEEVEGYDGETEDDVVVINIDDMDDGYEDTNSKSVAPVETRKSRIPEEVGRK